MHRAWAGVCAAVVACVVVGSVGVAAGGSPHSIRLTPVTASTQDDFLTPLAGSGATLVFSRHSHVAADANETASTDFGNAGGPDVIYARSASGQVRTVGMRPGDGGPFSLSVATLGETKLVEPSVENNHAYVWNLKTGKRVTITLPDADRYLTAAPHGVVYVTPAGVLRVKPISGPAKTLTTPFGHTARVRIISAASDADRVVVTDNAGHIAAVSFAAPHTATALQNPFGSTPLVCKQVAGTFAACASATSQPDADQPTYYPADPMLEPLDGSSPTVGSTGDCYQGDAAAVALAGSTLLWTCAADTETTATLYSLAAGGSVSEQGASNVGPPMVAAYGEAVLSDTPTQTSLGAATSATDLSTLIPTRASRTTVDTFDMSPDAIIYSDDQRVSSRPGELESVFTRKLSVKGRTVHASRPRLVGASATNVTGDLVGVTKSLTVYATRQPSGNGTFDNSVTLHVTYQGKTDSLPDAIPLEVQVAGQRVLYQHAEPGESWTDTIYNARTGRSTPVPHVPARYDDGIALSGTHVAYVTTHNAIYWVSLVTGKQIRIRRGSKGLVGFDVYADGTWVGWHQRTEGRPSLNMIRNVKTMTPAISLRHRLYSLTASGAILSAGRLARPTTFWLRSYSGHTSLLLPRASYRRGPEIAGHILAWASPSGALRIRALTVS